MRDANFMPWLMPPFGTPSQRRLSSRSWFVPNFRATATSIVRVLYAYSYGFALFITVRPVKHRSA